jgi:GNAT superfamily N-acetyltransferase
MAVDIRPFRPDDAHPVADLVHRCLRDVNSRDYAGEIIERMCAYFAPAQLEQLAEQRQMFVAESDGIVGTVSRDGNKVYTMFVAPPLIGRGIGWLLMRHVELLAAAEGHDHMETGDPYRRSRAAGGRLHSTDTPAAARSVRISMVLPRMTARSRTTGVSSGP